METKICSRCKLAKYVDQYNKKSSSKDGLSTYCKDCNKEKLKEHYNSNKDYYHNKSKDYSKKLQNWLEDYKKDFKCLKCGEHRHWVLDFHHREPSQKENTVSTMLRTSSRQKILEEIEKCDILCSNCHRDLHYQERLMV